jgi:hypothetical protein
VFEASKQEKCKSKKKCGDARNKKRQLAEINADQAIALNNEGQAVLAGLHYLTKQAHERNAAHQTCWIYMPSRKTTEVAATTSEPIQTPELATQEEPKRITKINCVHGRHQSGSQYQCQKSSFQL